MPCDFLLYYYTCSYMEVAVKQTDWLIFSPTLSQMPAVSMTTQRFATLSQVICNPSS